MEADPSGPYPAVLRVGDPIEFPDPGEADEDGLLAIGGDLAPERLLDAYEHGIFPCYGAGSPPLWWCPDPRAVIAPDTLHTSRRLGRRLRQGGFELGWNRAFAEVMAACDEHRPDGSWILPEMISAYVQLHRMGHAHSLEVWSGQELVGGLYGVQRGRLFAAESMFHRRTDASKVALVAAVRSLFETGIELFDVQFLTPHLESMGAREWSRQKYLARLSQVIRRPLDLSGLVPRS